MPCQSHHHHGITITLSHIILGLLILLPTYVEAQQPPPPHDNNSDGSSKDYSPPMATVLVVLIGLFFGVGFISVYLKHFAVCLGIGFGGRNPVGGDGGAWRRETARGLDPDVVNSFPTFLYSDVKVHRIGKGTLECAVCLNEFSDNEVLKLLPACSHVFHPQCIGPWLATHVTCPVCRSNLEFDHRKHFQMLVQQLQLSEDESEPSNQITQHHHDNHHHNRDITLSTMPSPDVITKSPVVVQEPKSISARIGSLPRSHSTGHSLVEDCERFKLRLPEDVRNKLVNTPSSCLLPAGIISPRIGYRARSVGCTGMPGKLDRWRFSVSPPFVLNSRPAGSIWSSSPKSDGPADTDNVNSTAGIMSGPRRLFKSIKSPFNRVVKTSDIGERSSDRLWPNRSSQDVELESQHSAVV